MWYSLRFLSLTCMILSHLRSCSNRWKTMESSVTYWNSLSPAGKLCVITIEFGRRYKHISDIFQDYCWPHSCLPGPASGIYSRDAQVLHRSGQTRLGQRKLQAHLVAWGYPMGKCPERCPHRRAEAEGECSSGLSCLLLFHFESNSIFVFLLMLRSLEASVS